MSLNWARARQLLADGDLRSLFIDALGWDHYTTPLDMTIDGSFLTLSALAHKRGMVAYRYATPSAHPLPNYAQRRKIEHQVAKAAHEHLIVFTDTANQTQIWQWVKREPGKPAACREHTFYRSQPGDALVQKLEAIAFTLEEEERLSLTDVTHRTRAGFDVECVTKRFYDRFQKEHTAFLRFISGITDRADHEWYASVTLNRLMFVYFIQRKGFLDNDRDYLRNRLNRMRDAHGEDKFYSFYRYFLLRLFWAAGNAVPNSKSSSAASLTSTAASSMSTSSNGPIATARAFRSRMMPSSISSTTSTSTSGTSTSGCAGKTHRRDPSWRRLKLTSATDPACPRPPPRLCPRCRPLQRPPVCYPSAYTPATVRTAPSRYWVPL